MVGNAKHYDVIKNNNKKLVRNLIREQEYISKSELAKLSSLTFPTVSQAVTELIAAGEIEEIIGKSSGGRPGNMYRLNPAYEQFLCAAFIQYTFVMKIYDYCGNVIEEATVPISKDVDDNQLIAIIKDITMKYPSLHKAVIGVPGIIVQGVIMHYPHCPKLQGIHLPNRLSQELNISTYLENDINAIAMSETTKWNSFAHIIWIQGCIGSAIVLDGKILPGSHGCAGEVEFACRNRDDRYSSLLDSMMAICSVVDVPIIVFSGDEITSEEVDMLREHINRTYPAFRRPEITYVENEQELYFVGLLRIMKQSLNDKIAD